MAKQLDGRTVMGLAAILLSTAPNTACSRPEQQSATVAPSVQAQQPAALKERSGRTLIDAKSLSLQQLIQSADRIFVGVVKDVQTRTVRLTEGDESTDAEVRHVTIEVKDGLKNMKTGELLTVKQLEAVSAPLHSGEEVVWFLAKDSQLGLTQPLGVSSGDFRIQTTASGARFVNNLRGNAGLWEGDLFQGDGFRRGEVIQAAKTMKLPQARITAIENRAVRDPEQAQISLDLLLAATKSSIK